jgi:beta-glucosidase
MDPEQKQKSFKLPAAFLYGAASSAHQVEGNNVNNDWWHEEQLGKLPKSGVAADHYNRFREDFNLAHKIGLNAMRISIEWSRIQPEPDVWDMEEVAHYRKVLHEMKAKGLTRMVTLHHFTLPIWLYNKGGFENSQIVFAFMHYAKFIAENLGDEIDLWNTINEPEVYTYMTSLRGMWPPFSSNPLRAFAVFRNMAKAHNVAYEAIKSVRPDAQIGMAKNNVYNEAFKAKSWLDTAAVKLNNWFANDWFLNKIKDNLDFIGLNYYFYHSLTVSWGGIQQRNLVGPKSDMGWRTYPKGIYYLLTGLAKKYNKPIYITENGIANARDDMRKDFIRQHLYWTSQAMAEGADVRGYFYWSLTDTHEWQDGFDPKFGLIEIDFATQKRTIRPSADIFKELQS